MKDLIDREAALNCFHAWVDKYGDVYTPDDTPEYQAIEALPSVRPERDTPKRVLWTGWKGCRYTRYNCPNCKKPVRNDDVYCHRCGQRLMFPHISFTNYVPGEKQDVIVRWDDEG